MALEPNWVYLPSSQRDELRQRLIGLCKSNLYFLAKGVLAYDRLVPRYHKPLCRHITRTDHNRKLYLLPRGTYKTTLISKANVIRLILNDPNERILIISMTEKNAADMLWEIKTHLESNELLRWLFPNLVPDLKTANRWNNQEILVRRTKDYSEATIAAMGVGGKLTSRHYTVHVKDDIVDQEVARSATELQRTKDWLRYTESVFVNPTQDRDFIVGTRYAVNDPYGDILSEAIPNTTAIPDFYNRDFVSNGYLVHMRSAREGGTCTLPELLDDMALERIKRNQGKFIFSSQYLNFPFTSETKSFDRQWLRYYSFDDAGNINLGEDPATGKSQTIPRHALYITMRVDPSSGESLSTRDRSAVIVDGVDSRGRVFILEAWAQKCKYFELYEQMCRLYSRWQPSKVGMETVAMAKIMGRQFREYALKKGLSPYLVQLKPTSKQDKEGRISAYDGRFEAGEIFIRPSMTDFIAEYEAFPDPSVPDDLLDAFAYGDQVWCKPLDDEDADSWEREEAQVLRFRRRSKTGY